VLHPEPVTTRGDAVAALQRAGGWATTRQLLAWTTARELAAAVAAGRVVRLTRGVYALSSLRPEFAAAAGLGGVVSHASAARVIGIALVRPPEAIHVTVPHGSARRQRPPGVVVHQVRTWFDGDVELGTTSALRTVLDCATTMPFPEALAVADSALKLLWVPKEELVEAARARPGAGGQRRLRVAEAADRRADNPFESVLRAALIAAGLTTFEPQGEIWLGRRLLRPDLVDRAARIAIEADSFAFHGSAEDLERDCERYDTLTAAGWTVLRFAYRQVMRRPDWVVATVRATRERVLDGRSPRRRSA
jgi:very-short-patch-repair endonuclease